MSRGRYFKVNKNMFFDVSFFVQMLHKFWIHMKIHIKMLSFMVLYISAVRLDYLSQSFTEWISSIIDYSLRIISPFFNDCLLKTFNIMPFFSNFLFKIAPYNEVQNIEIGRIWRPMIWFDTLWTTLIQIF